MKKISVKFGVVVAIILIAAMSRIMPHPLNFSPLVAISLFGGAMFKQNWKAYLIPIGAYFVSDLLFQLMGQQGFYGISQFFVYGSMLLVVLLGANMHQPKAVKVLGFTIAGSTIFWIISNFGVWVASRVHGAIEYEPALTLGMTYLRALPFYNTFGNQLFFGSFIGDLFYSGLIFGTYALAQKRLPVMKSA